MSRVEEPQFLLWQLHSLPVIKDEVLQPAVVARLEVDTRDGLARDLRRLEATAYLLTAPDRRDASGTALAGTRTVRGGRIDAGASGRHLLSVDFVFDDLRVTRAGRYFLQIRLAWIGGSRSAPRAVPVAEVTSLTFVCFERNHWAVTPPRRRR